MDVVPFYRSFYESIKKISDDVERCEVYDAIFEFAFEEKERELQGTGKFIFPIIKPLIFSTEKKRAANRINGQKGGRPKKQSETNETNGKTESNCNVIEVKRQQTFQKPTVAEIETYCKERKNTIDADSFYNFYESKNWMIGKNKMKDWKACVRTWEKRRQEEQDKKKEAESDSELDKYKELANYFGDICN